MTVFIDEARGHLPSAPRDPKPIVALILAAQRPTP
jgi:hypothetical protein